MINLGWWISNLICINNTTRFIDPRQEGTSKFASLESCAKEHQKRTHKRLQLQKEMVRPRPADKRNNGEILAALLGRHVVYSVRTLCCAAV